MQASYKSMSVLAIVLLPHLIMSTAVAQQLPWPLKDVAVTATRGVGGDINRIAATVSVITDQELEEQNVKDIKDALRAEPGVEVRRSVYRVGGFAGAANVGRGGNESVNIRGLDGNRVLLLEDGVALPRAFSQGALSAGRGAYTDTDLYQRIEILRGPAASMYGSDGLTGVLNFVSKDAQNLLEVFSKPRYFAWRPSYDSSDASYGSTVTAAFGNEHLQSMLLLTARHGHETANKGSNDSHGINRTKPDPLTYNKRAALGKLALQIDSHTALKLGIETVANRLRADSLSARNSVIDAYQSTSKVASNKLQLLWAQDNGDHSFLQKLRANLYYRDARTNQYSNESGKTERRTVRPRYRNIEYKDAIIGAAVQASSNVGGDSAQHQLTYGIDASVASLQMTASGTGWTTCTGTQYCEYFPKSQYRVMGIYLQDDMRLGKFSVIPGLRHDAYQIKPQASAKYDAQAIANGQPASISQDHALSPRLAFLYEVSPALVPYVQYARGLRAPSPHEVNSYFNNAAHGYSQLANAHLKPETSSAYEIGIRGKLRSAVGRINYSVAAFAGQYRDFIETRKSSGAGTAANPTIYQYVNAARAVIHGIEGRLAWYMQNGFSLKAGLAYAKGSRTENDGTASGLDSVAPLTIVAGTRYAANSRWFIQSDTTYHAAKRRSEIANKSHFVSPAFFLLGLNAGYHLSEHVSLFARIDNVFDRKYWRWNDIRGLSLVASARNNDAYTAAGRSVSISMKFEY